MRAEREDRRAITGTYKNRLNTPMARAADARRNFVATMPIPALMIDPYGPDPFSLVSWRANRLPNDPARVVWLMCAVLDLVYGWPFVEVLAAYVEREPRVLN